MKDEHSGTEHSGDEHTGDEHTGAVHSGDEHTGAVHTGDEVARRWLPERSGAHYRTRRWRGARARGRDARVLTALWRRRGEACAGPWLDAACGTGRLAGMELAAGGYVGVDIAPPMLGEHPRRDRVARASVFALPFADDAFELVVACRLLHHLADAATRQRALAELARVSSRWLAVTYWDASSRPGRRRLRGHRSDDRRRPLARAALTAEFAALGFELVGARTSIPWLTMQTWALFRARERA